MTPDFDDQDAQQLLASAEAILQAEDDRVDAEEWAEVVKLAEAVAEANRAVWQRTREIEALRGGPVSPASRELLHWLERDITAFGELLRGVADGPPGAPRMLYVRRLPAVPGDPVGARAGPVQLPGAAAPRRATSRP